MDKIEEEAEIGKLKGQKKGFNFPMLFVSGAMVLIAAAIIYLIFFLPNTTKDVRSEIREAPLSKIVSNLDGELSKTYPDLQLNKTPDQSNSNGYKLTGYGFSVLLPTKTDSLSYTDKTTSSEDATYIYLSQTAGTIAKYFNKNDFNQPSRQVNVTSILSSVNFYARKDAVCQVTLYTLLDITCDNKSDLVSIANTDSPLVGLYQASKTGVGQDSVTEAKNITSKTAGYSLASLDIFNDAGETKVNYYKQNTSSTAAWQMVNLDWYNDPHEDGDITPNCQDFESNLQTRAAYQGQVCYDSSNASSSTIN
jgi:hypothetical protein